MLNSMAPMSHKSHNSKQQRRPQRIQQRSGDRCCLYLPKTRPSLSNLCIVDWSFPEKPLSTWHHLLPQRWQLTCEVWELPSASALLTHTCRQKRNIIKIYEQKRSLPHSTQTS